MLKFLITGPREALFSAAERGEAGDCPTGLGYPDLLGKGGQIAPFGGISSGLDKLSLSAIAYAFA